MQVTSVRVMHEIVYDNTTIRLTKTFGKWLMDYIPRAGEVVFFGNACQVVARVKEVKWLTADNQVWLVMEPLIIGDAWEAHKRQSLAEAEAAEWRSGGFS